MYNMNMKNGHDAKVRILNPTDNEICQAKLNEVHHSNISWHPLLAEIFNSPISVETYHGQHDIGVVRRKSIQAANQVIGPVMQLFVKGSID